MIKVNRNYLKVTKISGGLGDSGFGSGEMGLSSYFAISFAYLMIFQCGACQRQLQNFKKIIKYVIDLSKTEEKSGFKT